MKPAYTIIIIGTGQHHQGHSTGNPERDADHQLKDLVDRLQATGQNITAAAFIVDDKPEMIIGKPEDLSFDTDAAGGVTLALIDEKIEQLAKSQNEGLKLLLQMSEKRTSPPLGVKAGAKKKGAEGKAEVELLQGEQTGKAPVEEDAGSKVDEKKVAEGDDAADGQQGHEQEVGGTAETTAQTEGAEG